MKPERITWIQAEPTPYWAHTFRAIADDPELDLTVLFLNQETDHHPWKSELTRGYDHRFPNETAGIEWSYLWYVLREPGFLVLGRWSTFMSNLLLVPLMLRSAPFGICTDTPDTVRQRPFPLSLVRRYWLRMVFRYVSAVLTTGEPGREALREMGCSPSRIVNFPFFVDLEFYRPSPGRSTDDGRIHLISSGRIQNEDKGYDLALQALARARSRGLSNVSYRIAGEGPDLPALRSLAEELGISDWVEFLGWMEPEELRDRMHESDALLHPAPRHDPFPVTVLEGMAAGLPILGSRAAGSVRDRVQHDVNGLIHDPGDVDALAQQLVELPERNLTKMGRRARETAENWPVERGLKILKDWMFQRE